MQNAELGGRGDPPAAAYLGPRNCEAVIGHSWRWARDHGKQWGVALLKVDGKSVMRASEFLAALEAHAEKPALVEPNEQDELARMRAAIRRAG